MSKRLYILGIILLQSVWAFSFSLDQSAIYATTSRGSQQSYPVLVRNDNDEPLTIKAYVRDWQYTQTRAKQFLPAGTTVYSCAKWITLSEEQFVVQPRTTKQIQLQLRTPESASGGHQSVVFFETEVPNTSASENILQYAARLGVIVYQDTERHSTYALPVKEAKASKVGDKVYYRLDLSNEGNTWNKAGVNISVLNGDDVIQQVQKGPYGLLPKETMQIEGLFESAGGATQIVYVLEDQRRNLSTGGVRFVTENLALVPEVATAASLLTEDLLADALPVSASVGGVELVDYAVKFQNKTRDLKVYVKLRSATPQTAKAFVKVTNASGVLVKKVELNEKRVVPDQSASMVVLWPIYNDLPAGAYQCELSLSVNGETLTQNRTVRW